MADLLSDIDTSHYKRLALFSKLSFAFSIISTILLAASFLSLSSTANNAVSRILVRATQASVLTGLTSSILSLVKKEKFKYIKLTGVLLNFMRFLFIVFAYLYATYIDWMWSHKSA